ncbi:MAG: hypothetical protein FJX35_12775 [Alphaproteobacteria bacterium]|nr:hypothetical protein [Alphaproteobacteria bacterium]
MVATSPTQESLFSAQDGQRLAGGFLTIAQTLALAELGNLVLDASSLLISAGVRLGVANRFYPGVVIEAAPGAVVTIGRGNTFWPGAVITVRAGTVTIGNDNQFGPGGFTASLDEAGAISIGSRCRCRDGASLFRGSVLGDGAQVLGPIQVQDCFLAAGGSFAEPAPDARGGVLKGVGRARHLTIGRGQVIEGSGRFDPADVKPQSFHHPSARAGS